MRARALLCLVTLLAACGSAPASSPETPTQPKAAAAKATPAAPPPSTPPSDVEAEKVIADALAQVAEVRKLAPKSSVKGVVISREALLERI